MTSSGDVRVAWVESPLQLLNAVEWAAATGSALVIHPRAEVRQLDRTVRALAAHLPPGVAISAPVRSAAGPEMRGAPSWLLGDVHSGQVKALLATVGVRDTVIVDDGSAAMDVAAALSSGGTLSRPGNDEPAHHRVLGRLASRRVAAAVRRGAVAFFTAYPDSTGFAALSAAGAEVTHNRYAWSRATHPVEPLGSDHVIVGTALLADGHIGRAAFSEWVASVRSESSVYVPHRREGEELRLVEELGVRVERIDVPIEVALASSPDVTRVTTLPSSVVATLRAILGSATTIDVVPVDPRWWADDADPRLRAMLEGIAVEEPGDDAPGHETTREE